MNASGYLMCCGCLMILGSGGSTVQRDTGYRVGGMAVTRQERIPGSCGGFLLGCCLVLCGYFLNEAGM